MPWEHQSPATVALLRYWQSGSSHRTYRAVDVGGKQQVERQSGQQVHNKPALQVVGGDVARIRDHLALLVHVGCAKVEDNVWQTRGENATEWYWPCAWSFQIIVRRPSHRRETRDLSASHWNMAATADDLSLWASVSVRHVSSRLTFPLVISAGIELKLVDWSAQSPAQSETRGRRRSKVRKKNH